MVVLGLAVAGAASLLWRWRWAWRADPDIVLIVIDTLRTDRLPFYGGEARTPFLNDLAAQSVVFERAHSVSSWTAPATASLFTSLYPNQHGVWTGLVAQTMFRIPRTNQIPHDIPTIPVVIRRLGSATFGVADNLNIAESLGFTRGFDHFVMREYEGAARIVETVLEWRPLLEASRRFVLYPDFMDPHHPCTRRDPWVREDAAAAHLEALEAWKREHERVRDALAA